MQNRLDPDKVMLMVAFARIDLSAIACAMGTLFSVAILLATLILVNQGGENTGQHLGLLAIYFPGYSVTTAGSFIGAAYFWLLGALLGAIFGALWNITHYIFIVLSVLRSRWWDMMAD